MTIQKIPIDYSYKKDNGTWVLHIDKKILPHDFDLQEQSIISIPAGASGGNHKHPRIEAFIPTSPDLVLYWIEDGQIKSEQMLQNDVLFLYIIPPFLPHGVKNTGASPAVLYELANAQQHDVEAVTLI